MFRPFKLPSINNDHELLDDSLTPANYADYTECIRDYLERGNLSFKVFKEVWASRGMSFLHHCTPNLVERALFTQSLFGACLSLFAPCIRLPKTTVPLPHEVGWKISVVYLLYCLYKTQPPPSKESIRVSPVTWKRLRDLMTLLSTDGFPVFGEDALCILHTLISEHAFVFAAYDGPVSDYSGTQSYFFAAQHAAVIDLQPDLDMWAAIDLNGYYNAHAAQMAAYAAAPPEVQASQPPPSNPITAQLVQDLMIGDAAHFRIIPEALDQGTLKKKTKKTLATGPPPPSSGQGARREAGSGGTEAEGLDKENEQQGARRESLLVKGKKKISKEEKRQMEALEKLREEARREQERRAKEAEEQEREQAAGAEGGGLAALGLMDLFGAPPIREDESTLAERQAIQAAMSRPREEGRGEGGGAGGKAGAKGKARKSSKDSRRVGLLQQSLEDAVQAMNAAGAGGGMGGGGGQGGEGLDDRIREIESVLQATTGKKRGRPPKKDKAMLELQKRERQLSTKAAKRKRADGEASGTEPRKKGRKRQEDITEGGQATRPTGGARRQHVQEDEEDEGWDFLDQDAAQAVQRRKGLGGGDGAAEGEQRAGLLGLGGGSASGPKLARGSGRGTRGVGGGVGSRGRGRGRGRGDAPSLSAVSGGGASDEVGGLMSDLLGLLPTPSQEEPPVTQKRATSGSGTTAKRGGGAGGASRGRGQGKAAAPARVSITERLRRAEQDDEDETDSEDDGWGDMYAAAQKRGDKQKDKAAPATSATRGAQKGKAARGGAETERPGGVSQGAANGMADTLNDLLGLVSLTGQAPSDEPVTRLAGQGETGASSGRSTAKKATGRGASAAAGRKPPARAAAEGGGGGGVDDTLADLMSLVSTDQQAPASQPPQIRQGAAATPAGEPSSKTTSTAAASKQKRAGRAQKKPRAAADADAMGSVMEDLMGLVPPPARAQEAPATPTSSAPATTAGPRDDAGGMADTLTDLMSLVPSAPSTASSASTKKSTAKRGGKASTRGRGQAAATIPRSDNPPASGGPAASGTGHMADTLSDLMGLLPSGTGTLQGAGPAQRAEAGGSARGGRGRGKAASGPKRPAARGKAAEAETRGGAGAAEGDMDSTMQSLLGLTPSATPTDAAGAGGGRAQSASHKAGPRTAKDSTRQKAAVASGGGPPPATGGPTARDAGQGGAAGSASEPQNARPEEQVLSSVEDSLAELERLLGGGEAQESPSPPRRPQPTPTSRRHESAAPQAAAQPEVREEEEKDVEEEKGEEELEDLAMDVLEEAEEAEEDDDEAILRRTREDEGGRGTGEGAIDRQREEEEEEDDDAILRRTRVANDDDEDEEEDDEAILRRVRQDGGGEAAREGTSTGGDDDAAILRRVREEEDDDDAILERARVQARLTTPAEAVVTPAAQPAVDEDEISLSCSVDEEEEEDDEAILRKTR